MIAAELANMRQGGDRKTINGSIDLLIPASLSHAKDAAMLNMGPARTHVERPALATAADIGP